MNHISFANSRVNYPPLLYIYIPHISDLISKRAVSVTIPRCECLLNICRREPYHMTCLKSCESLMYDSMMAGSSCALSITNRSQLQQVVPRMPRPAISSPFTITIHISLHHPGVHILSKTSPMQIRNRDHQNSSRSQATTRQSAQGVRLE